MGYSSEYVESLNMDIRKLEDEKKAYFDAILLLLSTRPDKEITMDNIHIATFVPSRYMIVKSEDFIAGTTTFKMKENNYGEK